jgi:hypothetical protein
VGLGRRRTRAQRIEYEGRTYFLGEDALTESRMTANRQDAGRIGSVEERVLMLASLARLDVDEALIVTGLPVMWWDHRRRLVRSWVGRHEIAWNGKPRTIAVHEVRPVWQPFGSFYARFLDQEGRATADDATMMAGFGVVDVGGNTTDLSGIVKLRPFSKWSRGVQLGVGNALEAVSADLEERIRRSPARGRAVRGHAQRGHDRDLSRNGGPAPAGRGSNAGAGRRGGVGVLAAVGAGRPLSHGAGQRRRGSVDGQGTGPGVSAQRRGVAQAWVVQCVGLCAVRPTAHFQGRSCGVSFCMTENKELCVVSDCCHTENGRRTGTRGRPPKAGRSVVITFRLREGEHDPILSRLRQLPRNRRSAYIRRVLSGAPVEVLDDALQQESDALASALDGAWDEEWDDV